MLQKVRIKWIVMLLVIWGCTGKSPYKNMLDRELASGVRNDSLFLDIGFGMGKKDFYAHCWDMNKQGLVKQGPNNLSVEYRMDSSTSLPVFMRFYPQFEENKIIRMPVEFSYVTFTPTDPSTSAETLLEEVKQLMEQWYGEGFLYMEDEEGMRKLWIKVDGNRQIRIFKKDVATVAVDITDMSVPSNQAEES